MLRLSRKAEETVVIANSITIKVVSVGPGRVELGIEAPREIPVHRGEIARRIAERNATRLDYTPALMRPSPQPALSDL